MLTSPKEVGISVLGTKSPHPAVPECPTGMDPSGERAAWLAGLVGVKHQLRCQVPARHRVALEHVGTARGPVHRQAVWCYAPR